MPDPSADLTDQPFSMPWISFWVMPLRPARRVPVRGQRRLTTVPDIPVRLADPDRDAAAVADIYRPAVDATIASFEAPAPDAAEMARRMRTMLERTPWLVAQMGESVIGYAYAGPHRERAGYRWSVDVSA